MNDQRTEEPKVIHCVPAGSRFTACGRDAMRQQIVFVRLRPGLNQPRVTCKQCKDKTT